MANQNAYIQTFAGGEFGNAMAARVGIEAYQSSCELMDNFFCQAQGPMTRRPSLGFIDTFPTGDTLGVIKGFQFDVGQNYLLLLNDGEIHFYLNDGILDIPEVTAALTNGTFTDFTGWSNSSDSGSSAAASGGRAVLTSNGAGSAKMRASVTINEVDTLHVLKFEVGVGLDVTLKIGSAAGGDQYELYEDLAPGVHYLSFTPTASPAHIEFSCGARGKAFLDNMEILSGPDFVVEAPWTANQLRSVFTAQDGDRLFMLSREVRSKVLERRGHRAWSLVDFIPRNGPYVFGNELTAISASGQYGEITITASQATFEPEDIGRLIKTTRVGQYQQKIISSVIESGATEPIKITGIGRDRQFSIEITGTWVGTVSLERSVGNQDNYTQVLTHTANVAVAYNDSYNNDDEPGTGTDEGLWNASGGLAGTGSEGLMNNMTVYYRLSVRPADYTSGTITMTISANNAGSQAGEALITAYTSATSVTAQVLKPFPGTAESYLWEMTPWSDLEEWPDVAAFSNGRLWLARRREVWASEVDDFFSFQEGSNFDNALTLTLRSKSAEGVRWMRHLDYLAIGTRNEEYVIRPASISEPLGPTNVEAALMSEEGGAAIQAQIGGDSILYVHRSGRRLMQFTHNPRALSETSFVSIDLNRLNPEGAEDGIVNMAIQQEPERRIFMVMKSGIVRTALFRREEDIIAWQTMSSRNALIEDVLVLTENDIDAVYFVVRRDLSGVGAAWTRTIERLADEVVLNDEDLVHLDCMLQTEISRPEALLLFSAIADVGDSITIRATDGVFSDTDEGKILWAKNGRFEITNWVDSATITVEVLNRPPDWDEEDNEDAIIDMTVPSQRWGIAETVTSVSGLDHLDGLTVQIWGDRAYLGEATVASGQVSIPGGASRVFVGLQMVSRWKGLKLAYGAQKGTAVLQQKTVPIIGFVLRRTADGLKFGQNFRRMKQLIVQDVTEANIGGRFFTGEIIAPFNGVYETDPRLTLHVSNPGPATITALVPNVQTNER